MKEILSSPDSDRLTAEWMFEFIDEYVPKKLPIPPSDLVSFRIMSKTPGGDYSKFWARDHIKAFVDGKWAICIYNHNRWHSLKFMSKYIKDKQKLLAINNRRYDFACIYDKIINRPTERPFKGLELK